MTMGAGTSGVMVIVLAWLISAFDWRNALLIIAANQLAVSPPLAPSAPARPEGIGLLPDGDLPDDPADEKSAAPAPPRAGDEGMTVRQSLASSAFWRLAIAVALGGVGCRTITVHPNPLLTNSVGLSE